MEFLTLPQTNSEVQPISTTQTLLLYINNFLLSLSFLTMRSRDFCFPFFSTSAVFYNHLVILIKVIV